MTILEELITGKGYGNLKEFASVIDIPYTTLRSINENGISRVTVNNAIKIAKGLNMSVERMNDTLKGMQIVEQEESYTYRYVPTAIAAGALENIDAMTELQEISIPDCMLGRFSRNKHIVIMRVNGESMNNIIDDGAVIAVLEGVEIDNISNGDIVIATDGGRDYTVKHFYDDRDNQQYILRPDSNNLAFHDIVIPYDNASDLKIFGKVVIYSVFL